MGRSRSDRKVRCREMAAFSGKGIALLLATLEEQERSSGPMEWHRPANAEAASLAVPKRGHVLSTVVEVYGKPIREAVSALSASLDERECTQLRGQLLSPRPERPEKNFERPDCEMVAWAIVSMWVVGVAVEELRPEASLADAERWFFGVEAFTPLLSRAVITEAEASLRSAVDIEAFHQLLPYILDPHGPGSRLSVRRDPSTRTARTRKRSEGVFYTPGDVAQYMARTCIAEFDAASPPTVFDPACGTGVFLRAALREILHLDPNKDAYSAACDCLFGADIDPWPLDAAAFVLLADTWGDVEGQAATPAEAWGRIRNNLACVDTLRIDPAADCVPQRASGTRVCLSQLFPLLSSGPAVILGNPPYADIGHRSDIGDVGSIFKTLAVKASANAEIYLTFIEQMLRLANTERCAASLVLPLSLACNVGRQFSTARELISKTRGRWRFAFFDREPHALFGEDVKTRNSIVHWRRLSCDNETKLETGPLRKWRGYAREAMFNSIHFTPVGSDIRAGIPKVDGEVQAAALGSLEKRWGRLEQVVRDIERINLADLPSADETAVFVGPTAYNFINVFLRPEALLDGLGQALSEHPLHVVRCCSRADALAVFAILSSHLAYWWWHSHGDGFHVSRRFIADLPFGMEAFTPSSRDTLARHGADLWELIESNPIVSLNRGKTSIAYTPNGHDVVRRKIDETLAGLAGLSEAFVDELQQFTAHTVSATLRGRSGIDTNKKGTT